MTTPVSDTERALAERVAALEAEIARLRAVEPDAWRITDGEGDYCYRTDEPEQFNIDWSARYGRKYEPLYLAAPPAQPVLRDPAYRTFEQFMALKDAPDIDCSESARQGWNACARLYNLPVYCTSIAAQPAEPVQPLQGDPVTLADVLDALNVFNKPRPSEGGEPWTEADFISVKHLPDFINIIAVAWFSRTQPAEPVQPVCSLCQGTGVVDDGEINCYPNGEPYENGPVKCVKDCPRCANKPPAEPVQRLSDAGIEALAGKHGTTYRNRHFPTQPAFSFSNGSLHRFVRDIESAIQPLPGWRDVESAPKGGCLIDILLPDGKRWAGCHYDAICDQWRNIGPSGHMVTVRADYATHWMPIPPAPKATK